MIAGIEIENESFHLYATIWSFETFYTCLQNFTILEISLGGRDLKYVV